LKRSKGEEAEEEGSGGYGEGKGPGEVAARHGNREDKSGAEDWQGPEKCEENQVVHDGHQVRGLG
jgi:hypothetical protein